MLSIPRYAYPICSNMTLNPITDICWQCTFPIRIGGVELVGSDIDDPGDLYKNMICTCNLRMGITVSFWETANIIETVKDPWCFPAIGIGLDDMSEGMLGGTTRGRNVTQNTFSQVHYYRFPVWAMLDMFTDFPCVDQDSFDIAYMTEVDPLWNNDILTTMINPEAILFGNPVTQMACIADSVASNAGLPINSLFWCMGSWGSAYPMSGHINDENYTQANAGIAARFLLKLTREGILWDKGSNVCGPIVLPIWVKNHYRLQIAKPVKDFTCHPVGRSSLIWGGGKNPPLGAGKNASDNFVWMLTKKVLCCSGLY